MHSTTHEAPESNSEQLPPKVITERNWQEFRAQGFAFWGNHIPDYPHLEQALLWDQEYFGKGNVYIGDAYDMDERRPLAHMPGVGVYIGPDAFEYADTHHPDESSPQPSSDTGPASS
jgi:hypothetical protein